MKAKWLGHSVQSDGHCIYWPDSQKVSVKRNIVFNMKEIPKLTPIIFSEDPKVSTYKRRQNLLQKTILSPMTPTCNLPSQPSKEGQIKEIFDFFPLLDFEDL